MWPSWGPVLTLARRRLLAVLSCQVLHIIQGNGPQSWLATQSGFKNNLMGKGKLMSICRDRREGREDSCPATHLELLRAGHFDLGLYPLVPQAPSPAPHS